MSRRYSGLGGRLLAVGAVCVVVAAGLFVSKWQWGGGGGESGPEPPPGQLSMPSLDIPERDPKIGPSTILVFERRWEHCENAYTRSVPAGEKLAGTTKELLADEFPEWRVESFADDRVVLVQSLPGDCPEPETPFTITIQEGRVLVLRGTGADSTVYYDTGIAASDLLPGDRMMLEQGITVVGEERVWAYLEGMSEDFGP